MEMMFNIFTIYIAISSLITVAVETVFRRICHVQLLVSRGTSLGHEKRLDCVDDRHAAAQLPS